MNEISIFKKIFHMLGQVAIGLSIVGIVYVSFILTRPHTYWFEYYSITSLHEIYELEGHPDFISESIITTVPHHMKWNDILRCDLDKDDAGYLYYSVYPSSYTQTEKGIKDSKWVYNSVTPDQPATCYIDSTICVESFGKDFCQKMESNTFRFE